MICRGIEISITGGGGEMVRAYLCVGFFLFFFTFFFFFTFSFFFFFFFYIMYSLLRYKNSHAS